MGEHHGVSTRNANGNYALCNIPINTHAWRHPGQYNPGFMCGTKGEWPPPTLSFSGAFSKVPAGITYAASFRMLNTGLGTEARVSEVLLNGKKSSVECTAGSTGDCQWFDCETTDITTAAKGKVAVTVAYTRAQPTKYTPVGKPIVQVSGLPCNVRREGG